MNLKWHDELSASDRTLHDMMLRQSFRLPVPTQTAKLKAVRSSYENQNSIFEVVRGWDDGGVFHDAQKMSTVENHL